jgi:hypothetical protein
MSSANVHVPASNTAAIITYAALTGYSHVLAGLKWSYDAAPTGGNLKITDGGTLVFSEDITAAGPGFFDFEPPIMGTPGAAVVITLAAGGGGISGKVNCPSKWVQQ